MIRQFAETFVFAAAVAAEPTAVAAPLASWAEVRLDGCGYGYPVYGYEAAVLDRRLEMPDFGALVVDGAVVSSTAEARRWVDSHDRAAVAVWPRVNRAGSYAVAVLASWTDCIDFAGSTLYVLDRSGGLRSRFAVPFPHLTPRVAMRGVTGATEPDVLVWRDADCTDPERRDADGSVLIFALRGDRADFAEERVEASVVCSTQSRVNQLRFAPMKPILTPPAPHEPAIAP